MDEFSRRYAQTLFERDYPMPPPEETLDQTAGKAMTSPSKDAAAKHPAMTGGDLGTVIMDTLAGLLKGAIQGSGGVFGDVESLARMATGGQQKLPTTEDVKKLLPQIIEEGRQADPRRRATTESSEAVGEFLSPVPLVKGVVNAVRKIIKYGADGKRVSTEAATVSEGAGKIIKYDARGKREAEATR